MKLSIHAHQIPASRELTEFIRKHLVAPLGRQHDSPAAELTVYVEDARPGRGGVDQACKVTFRMPRARTLRVESVQGDLHAALLECARRLRRLAGRQLEKMRSPSRAPEHKPLGRTWRRVASRRGVAPDGTPATL